MLTAIETTGTINAGRQITLDDDLPTNAPSQVRVILLFDDEADLHEHEWLRAASKNDVFELLNGDDQDIYKATDGTPIQNEE